MPKKRKIPVLKIEDLTDINKGVFYKSLIEGVNEGILKKLQKIKLAEIENHGLYLTIPKHEWSGGLQSALDYFESEEEYEYCSQIQTLIKKL